MLLLVSWMLPLENWCPQLVLLFLFFLLKDAELPHGNVHKKRMLIIHHIVCYSLFPSRASFGNKDVHDYLQGWLRVFDIEIKTITKVTIIQWLLLSPCCASLVLASAKDHISGTEIVHQQQGECRASSKQGIKERTHSGRKGPLLAVHVQRLPRVPCFALSFFIGIILQPKPRFSCCQMHHLSSEWQKRSSR